MNVPGPRLNRLTLAFVACAAACVPRGDPPAGRHIVADRLSTPVGFVPSNGDGVTRVLVTRPSQSGLGADLSVVMLDATGGPPAELLLATNVTTDFTLPASIYTNCGGTDARGRLFLRISQIPYAPAALSRIDPLTGDRFDLGAADSCLLSQSGDRLLAMTNRTATLYDANDQASPLDWATGAFAGEDLCYVTSQQQVMRLSPDAPPQLLASGVTDLSVMVTDTGPALLLARSTQDPLFQDHSLLDLTTGRETALPFPERAQFSLSPDGRWFAAVSYESERAAFIDWKTGDQEPFTVLPSAASLWSWRPGHDEFWTGTIGGSISMRAPGGRSAEYALEVTTLQDQGMFPSMFTPDGAFLFSVSTPADQYTPQVGSADDPTGPTFAFPQGTTFGYWNLADGRLLIPTFTEMPERTNAYVLDPTNGDTRVMGELGQVLAVGRSRLLVNQHLVQHEGDLTVFDLVSGQPTVLAPEFASRAVVESVAGDDMAPGAPLAFGFQARFPSPYDGVWLTTVP